MEYKFQKKHVSNSTFHLIECKEKHLLENFSIYNWTPALAQAPAPASVPLVVYTKHIATKPLPSE